VHVFFVVLAGAVLDVDFNIEALVDRMWRNPVQEEQAHNIATDKHQVDPGH
jgi:hypothetical protein